MGKKNLILRKSGGSQPAGPMRSLVPKLTKRERRQLQTHDYRSQGPYDEGPSVPFGIFAAITERTHANRQTVRNRKTEEKFMQPRGTGADTVSVPGNFSSRYEKDWIMRDSIGSKLFWASIILLGGSLGVTGVEGNAAVGGFLSGFWDNLEGHEFFGIPYTWFAFSLGFIILAKVAFPALTQTFLAHLLQAPGNLAFGVWRAVSLSTKFVLCGGDVVAARLQFFNGTMADSPLSRWLLNSNCLDSALARRENGEAQSALAQKWEQFHSEEANLHRTPMQRTAASPQVQGAMAYVGAIVIAAMCFWAGYNWATGTRLPDAIAKLRPASATAATATAEKLEAPKTEPKTETAAPATAPTTTTEAKAAPAQQAPVVEAVSTSASAPSKI